jgi:hypothetical protein
MAHDHAHEDRTSYFLEQISNIAICGLLGGVAVMMYRQGMLYYILAPWAHLPVIIGGAVLLALVLVRAAAVWIETGSARADAGHQHGPGCAHDHDHTHEHAHEHPHAHEHHHAGEPCGHDHPAAAADDCGHDHSWNGWRYALLLLPAVLYFLNLPNSGFSNDYIEKNSQAVVLDDDGQIDVKVKNDRPRVLEFKELEKAAGNEELRADYEGHMGKIKGQFSPISDKIFTLVRMKMTCCAADAVPVKVAILSPEPVKIPPGQWVEVTGQIQFRKQTGKNEFIPILQLRSGADAVPIEPDTNPFLQ